MPPAFTVTVCPVSIRPLSYMKAPPGQELGHLTPWLGS